MIDDVALARRLSAATPARWRRPGFERPLAGLLLHTVALLLLTGPFLYVTALLVPSRVQPFPAVDGVLGTIEELLLLGWAIGDFGITTAITRAVAARRAEEPEAVLPLLRLLVGWQLGVAVLLCLAGTFVAPMLMGTRFEALSFALRIRAFTAPLLVVSALPALFESLQRYDRQLLLDLLDDRVLMVLVPIPIVLWLGGPHDPQRALVGVVIGQGIAMGLTGMVGLVLVRRIGLPLRALVIGRRPSRTELGALLRYGAGIMSGKAIFFVAGLVELTLVVARLRDYPTWLGVKVILVGKLLQPLWLLWPFCETVVPSLSEALSAGKLDLARAYVVRYLQHGNLFVMTLFALVLGAAPPLLVAYLPPAWHAAARLLPLAGLTGLLLPLTWVGDGVQRACGKSGLNAGFLLGEQLLRLALLWVLLPRFGLVGLFAATAIAAACKSIAVLLHVDTRLLSLCLPLRSIVVAPLLAGVVVACVSRGLVRLVGHPIAFVVAALVAFPLAYFVAALAGGLEPAAREELEVARTMVPLQRITAPFATWLCRAANLGARISGGGSNDPSTIAAMTQRDALAALQAADMN